MHFKNALFFSVRKGVVKNAPGMSVPIFESVDKSREWESDTKTLIEAYENETDAVSCQHVKIFYTSINLSQKGFKKLSICIKFVKEKPSEIVMDDISKIPAVGVFFYFFQMGILSWVWWIWNWCIFWEDHTQANYSRLPNECAVSIKRSG